MGRPSKNNADYFSHDNDMRNNDKIKAVRRRFGHEGYSVWNMILEKLCHAGDFTLKYNDINIELWAGDFEIDPGKLREMVDYFLKLELLIEHEGMIFSEAMIMRFNPLLVKRKRSKEKFLSQKPPDKEVSEVGNTQSKVKERKVNKSKVKKRVFTPPTLEDVILYFEEKGFSKELAGRAFEYYNTAQWHDSNGKQVKNWKQKMLSIWMKPENKPEEKKSHVEQRFEENELLKKMNEQIYGGGIANS